MKTVRLILSISSMTVMLIACKNVKTGFDASGVFEATEVTVSALGTGEIKQFNLYEGEYIEAGIQIGYVDTLQLHLKKEQLSASLQSVGSRRYNVSQQIASLKQQIETQKRERERFKNLVESNAANQKQLDDIDAQISMLEKQLAAQTETLENGNRSVNAEVHGIEAQIAQLTDQIAKNIITSPVSGTALSKYAEQGEFAAQGRALFKVADLNNIYLRAYIAADQLTTMNIGQKVKVYADRGERDRTEYQGTVVWISNNAEFTPKTIQTRDERANLVYAVKVAVKNDGCIKLGMYGEIKID